MDNHDIPFHAPVSVAVRLDTLEAAVRKGIISQTQAHELWTLWVSGPERLTESTVPMPLSNTADLDEPPTAWAKAVQYMTGMRSWWGRQ